jgi:hypothetical protein
MNNALNQSRRHGLRRRLIELTVTTHLEQFDFYVSKMSADLTGEKELIQKRLDEMSAGLSDDEVTFLEYEFSDEFYLIDDVFLPLFLQSSTISLFAFFESELTSLCKSLARSSNQSGIWTSLNRSGILKAKKYLKTHAGVDFDPLNLYWANLNNMLLVRNCLAHANGDIDQMSSDDKQVRLRQIATSTNGLNIADDKHLLVERRYLQERSADVRRFLIDLSEQVYP